MLSLRLFFFLIITHLETTCAFRTICLVQDNVRITGMEVQNIFELRVFPTFFSNSNSVDIIKNNNLYTIGNLLLKTDCLFACAATLSIGRNVPELLDLQRTAPRNKEYKI
jgi:hypothetical protein